MSRILLSPFASPAGYVRQGQLAVVVSACGLAVLAPFTASAQRPLVLAKPDAEYAEPFSQLSAVRELRDGRVIATDVRDKVVQLIDLRTGNAVKVGREGQGPGEYAMPQTLVALPGDTTALWDPLNTRYLLIGPDGKTGGEFRLEEAPTPGPGGRGGMLIGGANPRGTDTRGRIFYEGRALSFSDQGAPVIADTAPILRYDRSTKRSDTLAWVHLPPNNVRVSGGRGNTMVMMGAQPFARRDEWAPLPDGGVAIARVADYHVDLFAANGARRASGPAVRFDVLPVTEADKDEYRKARMSAIGMTVRVEGGVTTRGAGPVGNIPAMPEPEWPATKPPFGSQSVFARSNGEVWVLRSRRAGDRVPVYDVFDATGRMIGRVQLPERTRLIGFGNGTVYVVRVDEDDLQYLQRYRLAMDAKLTG
jgi:hypothetical protein